ncbi:nucleotide sugar dehydrogenase [Cohnella sp. WQ 127256]|uniref:nucleotide sugar dehydrogenase n=1 Tax=Cohnella sp. WQ 127256 TaxID=2938790 RepID=UPI0021172EB3|nr:nucleotide sugar dehydrogenase [Cohnella sp. WQ 127256]
MNETIGVVGLGYVGLPLANAFGEKYTTIGFDTNEQRVNALIQGIDHTGEVGLAELRASRIQFTTDPTRLEECRFIVVAVPTPIDHAKKPNLTPLIKASETVGNHLRKGTVVVYESTVYPGTTEEICIPILERHSGLIAGKDFKIGYSPERINPGDKQHTFKTITKVVSGQDEESLELIADVYGSVVDAGIFRASSIKVAEAAKVIENTQRDINIALMNELAIIFERLGIDTTEVLEASSTKWNFLNFKPGLVGGHCIGVDPYYLTYKAESVGYHPEVILAGRRVNDRMGQYVATTLVKQMILRDIPVQGSKVAVLGLTFKENVPDIRNTKVIDIIKELKDYGVEVNVIDPFANAEEAMQEYGIQLKTMESVYCSNDAVIVAVPHNEFVSMGWNGIVSLLRNTHGIVIDVKSTLKVDGCPKNITLRRL